MIKRLLPFTLRLCSDTYDDMRDARDMAGFQALDGEGKGGVNEERGEGGRFDLIHTPISETGNGRRP